MMEKTKRNKLWVGFIVIVKAGGEMTEHLRLVKISHRSRKTGPQAGSDQSQQYLESSYGEVLSI